jgi:hypothetical protein
MSQEDPPERLSSLEGDNALGGVPPDMEGATPYWTRVVSGVQEAVKYQVSQGNLTFPSSQDKEWPNDMA